MYNIWLTRKKFPVGCIVVTKDKRYGMVREYFYAGDALYLDIGICHTKDATRLIQKVIPKQIPDGYIFPDEVLEEAINNFDKKNNKCKHPNHSTEGFEVEQLILVDNNFVIEISTNDENIWNSQLEICGSGTVRNGNGRNKIVENYTIYSVHLI